jgi:hypothetical protein
VINGNSALYFNGPPCAYWGVGGLCAKQTDTHSDADWGTVQIFVYPTGTKIPPNKQPQLGTISKATSDQPVQASAAATPKPL